jgi:hypothetical protein
LNEGPVVSENLVHGRADERLTRDSEGVQAIVVDEVLDLVDTCLTWVCNARGLACAINGAAEVKTCDLLRKSWSVVFKE